MKTENMQTESYICDGVVSSANRWDHFLARFGWRRSHHRVKPGLYKLGNPTQESPVFVSANYTLSFDVLRSSLKGIDGYILVLDTKGINVWCAAGKGTFGTEELVHRIEMTKLPEMVKHGMIILPQLGAPGVCAHEVRKRSGFKVEYGPVRALDLPKYLKTRTANAEMRRVRFNLKDRLVLIPVENKAFLFIIIIVIFAGLFTKDIWKSLQIFGILMTGLALFPILLPWIPTRDFTTKGFLLGGVAVIMIYSLPSYLMNGIVGWALVFETLINMLIMTPVVAYLALNFTSSTTFTSRTGVKREIFKYIPILAVMIISGIVLSVIRS
jgi:hypothetical protein